MLPVHGQAVEDLVVVARLNRYLPVNGHVVIDCGLLTAVDLVVLALARSPGVTGSGVCPLSVLVRAFTSICSSGSLP